MAVDTEKRTGDKAVDTAAEKRADAAAEERADTATDETDARPDSEAENSTDVESVAEEAKSTDGPVRHSRLRRVLTALVVVALVAGIGVLGWQWWQQRAEAQLRESAASEASRLVAQLATYDYTDVEANLNTVIADATPEFGNRYREVAAGLEEILVNGQGSSTGTVTHAAVESLTADHATVLVFLDQDVTNLAAPEGRVDASRMVVGLVRDGDRWLLDSADLA